MRMTSVSAGVARLALTGAVVLAAAFTAGAVPAQAAVNAASNLNCSNDSVCLFDGAGRRFLTLPEGCWFNNIGAQGYSDKTRAAVNNTAYRVNLANWLAGENRWEHIVTVPPNGGEVSVPDRGLGGVDAVHSIC
ncbi:hypothetical protein [Streptosporangium saharense]|uniref:Peptidase inhibitor family I36 n=1 Tax=Streptosporangium saharense TaxID=1706840 RepID=A0A7W7QK16_9ACTN|nr:hypothetical protein [Streptosporangium saharense]MBB4914994.1 hypothetical protein [Streptosporangium saharense]